MHRTIWRKSLMMLTVLAVPLLLSAGNQPNFGGTWKLDPAKSPGANGATITLNIKDEAGNITYERSMRQADGKQVEAHFACSPGGKECEFDENGHKAKVSLWYNGAALMILKTNGPKEDAMIERKLELSSDGNTLNVQFTDLDKDSKPQVLVFTKEPPLNAAAK
jgi:hypothetical protein